MNAQDVNERLLPDSACETVVARQHKLSAATEPAKQSCPVGELTDIVCTFHTFPPHSLHHSYTAIPPAVCTSAPTS
jgi:hypothetical protein